MKRFRMLKKYGGIVRLFYLEGYDNRGKFTTINDVYKNELKTSNDYYVGNIIYRTGIK